MKKLFLSVFCLLLANFVFAQVIDSTTIKTEIKKIITTTTTTTTVVTTEKTDTIHKRNRRIRGDTQKKNAVKLSVFSLSYERALNKKVTVQFITHFLFEGQNTANTTTNSQTSTTKSSGFGIGAELRYYPKSAFNGFFVAFSPRYQNYNFTATKSVKDNNGNVSDAKANWNAYNVALLLGKQWIFNDKISLDIFAGPAFVGGVLDITNGKRDNFLLWGTGINTGVTLRAGLSVGYVF